MKRSIAFLVLPAAIFLSAVPATMPSFACTDFQVKAEDGTVIIARANELGIDAHSDIVFVPAGIPFAGKAPGGKEGLSWKSRYAFLGINGLGLKKNYADGMNEAGLSMEELMFPGTQYETVSPDQAARAVSILDLSSWILGNFATVDELKKELPAIRVWAEPVPEIGAVLPLHVAVHDAAGNNLVIEFVGGEKKVYDNPIGVMTNLLELPWQITNLRTYLGMDSANPPERNFRGVTIAPAGTAVGWRGIPGDWSPPSRYVRIAYLVNMAAPVKDGRAALGLAKHILNTVDIPLGIIVAGMAEHPGQTEYTQWSVLKDLTNRVLYYYTYDNMNLRAIDLRKLVADSPRKSKTIPMAEDFSFVDRTKGMKETE